MASTARRTDPELWEEVKAEVTAGGKGGRKGQWSARKAQVAVQAYQQRGGGYEGPKRADNSLRQWTEEDWGTKSGRKSGKTGERYLPKQARAALSDEEYARTTREEAPGQRARPAVLRPAGGCQAQDGEVPARRQVRRRRADEGRALRASQAAGHHEPLEDEQGRAGQSARSLKRREPAEGRIVGPRLRAYEKGHRPGPSPLRAAPAGRRERQPLALLADDLGPRPSRDLSRAARVRWALDRSGRAG